MTTQPSIESLRDYLERTTYPPRELTEDGVVMLEVLGLALTELESLRASEAALRAERDALKEHAGHRPSLETIATTHTRMPVAALATEQGHRKYAQHPDSECYICALIGQLSAAESRAAEAERERDTFSRCMDLMADSKPTKMTRLDAFTEDFKNILAHWQEEAARHESRADALAARVEALEDGLKEIVAHVNKVGDGGGHWWYMNYAQTLLLTPCTYSLSAHDARIRREEREAAAKKCAEAYWAMVAPKDHAAMHPTIEFWRDALGLEPMSTTEYEALAALEPRHPEIVLVDDLAMLVRLLVHSLRKHSPDNETARKAVDYLRRHELQGSPLRTTILSLAPDAENKEPK